MQPCSSKKVGDLPRKSFKWTGVLMRHPPPVTVKHFFREEPSPAVISSSSLARYELPRRSDGKPGNIARNNTSCRILIISLQARDDFKPFSIRRASLSPIHQAKWINRSVLEGGNKIFWQMFSWFPCIFTQAVVLPLDKVFCFTSFNSVYYARLRKRP